MSLALLGLSLGGLAGLPGSPAAAAKGCAALSDADLSFAAPVLSGSAPAAGACWRLPTVAGDVLEVGAIGGRVAVLDADDAVVCSATATAACALTGVAPYELRIPAGTGSYRVVVARLDDARGCGALPLTGFGGAVPPSGRAALVAPAVACARGTVPAGHYAIAASTTWHAFDASGDEVCGAGPACDLAGDTDLTVVSGADDAGAPVDTVLVPLAATTRGCGSISSDWSAAPTTIDLGSLQFACQQVAAPPADRLLVQQDLPQVPRSAGTDGIWTETVDDTGAEAAAGASGTRRLISYVDPARARDLGGDSYRVAVGDLTQPVGCPSIAPRAYGLVTAPAGADSCRVLAPPRSGVHLLDTTDLGGFTVTDQTGATVCDTYDQPCRLVGGASYVLVLTDLASPAAISFQRLDAPGCTLLDATPQSTADGPATAIGCAQLPYPRGARVAVLTVSDAESPVYDATGSLVCAGGGIPHACPLTGPAPYRTILAIGGDHHVAADRLDQPSGCTPFAPGAYGTTDGIDLTFTDTSFAQCFVPTGASVQGRAMYAAERTSAAGQAHLWLVDHPDGFGGCAFDVAPIGSGICDESATAAPQVLLSGGTSGSFRLALRSTTGDPSCRPLTAAERTGTPIQGALTDFLDMDCFTLSGAAADRYAVQLATGVRAYTNLDIHTVTDPGAPGDPGDPADSVDDLCDGGFGEPCLVDGGARSSQLVVQQPSYAGPRPFPSHYALTTFRYHSATGWDPSCLHSSSAPADGFGPLTLTVTPAHRFGCVVVPENGGRLVVDNGPTASSLAVLGVGASASSTVDCGFANGLPQETCSGFGAHVGDEGALLVALNSGDSGATRVDLSGACVGAPTCRPHRVVVRTPPRITSTALVGRTLRVDVGSWSPTPNTTLPVPGSNGYDVGWLLDGRRVASGPTLSVPVSYLGHRLEARVVARRTSFAPGVAVTAAQIVGPGPAPVALAPPRVIGSHRVGSLVTLTRGRWTPAPTAYEILWRADGRLLRETSRTLHLRPELRGTRITATVRALLAGHRTGRATATPFVVR